MSELNFGNFDDLWSGHPDLMAMDEAAASKETAGTIITEQDPSLILAVLAEFQEGDVLEAFTEPQEVNGELHNTAYIFTKRSGREWTVSLPDGEVPVIITGSSSQDGHVLFPGIIVKGQGLRFGVLETVERLNWVPDPEPDYSHLTLPPSELDPVAVEIFESKGFVVAGDDGKPYWRVAQQDLITEPIGFARSMSRQ